MKTRRTLNNKSKYNFKFGKPYSKTKKPTRDFNFISKINKSRFILSGITIMIMVAILLTGIHYFNNRFLVVYADGEAIGYVSDQEKYYEFVKVLETAGPTSCDAMLLKEDALPKAIGTMDASTMSMMAMSSIPSINNAVKSTSVAKDNGSEEKKKTQYEITTALSLQTVWSRPKTLPELTIGSLLNSVEIQVNAAVILIDGKEVATLPTKEEAQDIVNIIVQGYTTARGGSTIVDYSIKEDLKIEYRPVVATSVMKKNDALNLLSTGYTQRKYHIVKRGDSLWSIGNDNGMTVKEVRACNPELKSAVLMLGQKIAVEPLVPFINIETKEQLTTFEYTPYKTVYEKDSSLYTWQTKTLTEGVKGKNEVVYDIVRENGKEVSRTLVSTTLISEPITKVVAKGTKIPKAQGTGKFIWPVDGGGTITSKFGWTGRRYHYGLDIGTARNTNIFAADSGVVTTATYHYLYGYYIIIDHGNGYSTLYAHNNKLLVKVGQKVSQGTIIAKSGNTGNSTGPHLHLEIRKDGKRYNPLNYYK